MFRKAIKLAVSAAVLLGALSLPATGQAASCEADQCFPVTTNAAGKASFSFQPVAILIAEQKAGVKLSDCIWQVDAIFSDKAPTEHYVFDAKKGLGASHTFPAPGEYRVDLVAPEGEHAEAPGTKCPSFHFIIEVTYPEPQPPQEEKPVEEPPVKKPVEEPPLEDRPAAGGQQGGVTEEASSPVAGVERWRHCKGSVYTHNVSCRKGRKVAKAALAELGDRRGAAKIDGYACSLRPSRSRPLSCVRGESRILGPLA